MNLLDSPFGLLSCWVRVEEYDTSFWTLFDSNIMYAWITRGIGNGDVQLFFPIGGVLFEFENDGAEIREEEQGLSWRHILCSWNFAGASFEGHIYVDDVLYPNFVTGVYVPQDIRWSLLRELRIFRPINAPFGGDFSNTLKGCVGQFYLNTQEYLDLTVVTNRRKFYDPSGRVVDLGLNGEVPTGSTPSFFFRGRTTGISRFSVNRGTFDIPFPLVDELDCPVIPPTPVVPPDPVDLLGFVNNPTSVFLIWFFPFGYSNGGSAATEYRIYQDVGNVTPTTFLTTISPYLTSVFIPVDGPTFTAQGYSYIVTAVNVAGESAPSVVAFVQNQEDTVLWLLVLVQ